MQTKLILFSTTFLALLLVYVSFSPLLHTFNNDVKAQSTHVAIIEAGDNGDGVVTSGDDSGIITSGDDSGVVNSGDDSNGGIFTNPIDADDIFDLINKFVNLVVEIGAIVAVIFIIWSGFLFVKAQGKPEELKKAKNTFYTTIIGTAILLGASVITKIIVNTVKSVTGDITP